MNKPLMLVVAATAVLGLVACTTFQSDSPAVVQQMSMNHSAELSAYHWTLSTVVVKGQAAAPAPLVAGSKPLVLDFSQQQISVSGLCNQLGGSYTLDDERISISQMVGTRMACADSQLMRYEQEVGQQLPAVTHWQLDKSAVAPVLLLSFADGSQWQLQGEPTAETLYGGEPQWVFLEVAPQRVACSHPLIPDYQCLQVREVIYDERGIKLGTGDWGNYYGAIQGHEHQPGVRQVLRINRYTRSNPPADASSQVDILDRVVETEVVSRP